jgi:hypothetical protein
MDLRHHVFAVDDDGFVPLGARSATCSTARFSVTLIFSPRNIASMRDPQPGFLRQLKRSLIVSSVTRFFE